MQIILSTIWKMQVKKKYKYYLIMFLILSNSNLCIANGDVGDQMDEKLINVNLEIKSNNENIIAELTFSNLSSYPIFLDKNNVNLDSELLSRLFEIYDKNNSRVNFKGMTIKRKFDKNNFIKIEPNESISTTVILNKWYDFFNGENEYSIKYDAINHSFEDQKMFEMTSDTMIIKFKK